MIFNKLRTKPKKRKHRLTLTIIIALIVLAVMIVALGISFCFVWILLSAGVISVGKNGLNDINLIILIMVGMSLVIGFGISIITSKTPLNPINKVINQMERLSKGDFSARLEIQKPFGEHPSVSEFCDSFNKMAEELGNTEMLRADFINNFSHEFKTPIVSIAGFAKLLKKGNLTEAQQKEYLDIIEEESLRLSSMATNVLNLTKVENQTILSDVSTFNLAEQIRTCAVITADKWSKKEIDFCANLDECEITANQELLKQVWLNLIDNAVKFCPFAGSIDVLIRKSLSAVSITIINDSETLSEDELKLIFNKFYQSDKSHSTEGYGVGLSLVKHIVELHKGTVEAKSKNNKTSFIVTLPLNQT